MGFLFGLKDKLMFMIGGVASVAMGIMYMVILKKDNSIKDLEKDNIIKDVDVQLKSETIDHLKEKIEVDNRVHNFENRISDIVQEDIDTKVVDRVDNIEEGKVVKFKI